jgi:UDP-N-acetylmuramate dehydrogenase
VESGATLQELVDRSIELGLKGVQTLTGIPGFVGGAIYGNAGAYGHSIEEVVTNVFVTDGNRIDTVRKEDCGFAYRDSAFKRQKHKIILGAELQLAEDDGRLLAKAASEIRTIRDAKDPPSMRCAGSIFKNVFWTDLPARAQHAVPLALVRDGKVPSAFFLELVDAKGMRRGDIQVASYHANLIYNDGVGTAADLVSVIAELKARVRDRFEFNLEEEVQYVGF